MIRCSLTLALCVVFLSEVSSLPSSHPFLDSYEDGLDSNTDRVKENEDQAAQSIEDSASVAGNQLAMKNSGKRSPSETAPISVECCQDSEHRLLIYRFEATAMNHHDALKNCQRNGGELATPLNMKEFIVLEAFVRPLLGNTFGYVGYNDIEQEGTFVDNTGHPAVINNYFPNEPNNQGNEDCVEMQGSSGKFNDQTCTSGRQSICEFRIPGY
ncbi:tetranectin-like protein [Sycon ciliatum]|uniref:tetranectin-like protein n=1 Tax=Sycon ciliatum TaxID=27933 RepID=UPI0031F70F65